MIKQYYKQAMQLWKSNPLFATISILATGLTITFVMVLYMVYAIRTVDISPEINRSRTLYSNNGYSYLTKDHSKANRGMSYNAAKTIFGNLEHAETVSYFTYKGEGVGFIGTSQSDFDKGIISTVDNNYFKIFNYDFIQGEPFTKEQADAARKEAIITDKIAIKFFNTTDVIGKEVRIGLSSYFKITGVVKSMSSVFNKAYSDVWIVVDKNSMNWESSEDLRGNCITAIVAKQGSSLKQLNKEIEENVKKLNDNLREFTFELEMNTHAQSNFFEDSKINPARIFVVLIFILLIVPAINMSGLLSTQLKKRSSEVGIRKAYGASNSQVAKQLLYENFILTIVGGIIGLLFSVITIFVFKDAFLSDLMTFNVSDSFHLPLKALFRPSLFLLAFIFCLLINLLSAIIPVWSASKKTIIETIKGE